MYSKMLSCFTVSEAILQMVLELGLKCVACVSWL